MNATFPPPVVRFEYSVEEPPADVLIPRLRQIINDKQARINRLEEQIAALQAELGLPRILKGS